MKPSAHKHLIVRAIFNSFPKPEETEYFNTFIRDLIRKVRMQILVQPQTIWCDHPGNEGHTSTCIISTSHCVLHTFEADSTFQFDLYSCAPFTPEEVVACIREYFDVASIEYKFIDREKDLSLIE